MGALAFLTGWFLDLSPRLDRQTARTHLPGWASASALLLVVVALGAGGQRGWTTYQHWQDTKRLHAAERALAAIHLRATMTETSQCLKTPDNRCGRSSLSSSALVAELAVLVHAFVEEGPCPPDHLGPNGIPCPTELKGKVAGYPAFAFVHAALVTAIPGQPVPGGTRIKMGNRLTNLYYTGMQWEIDLLPADVR